MLVSERAIETSAAEAGCLRQIVQRRACVTGGPEAVPRSRNDVFFDELPRASHDPIVAIINRSFQNLRAMMCPMVGRPHRRAFLSVLPLAAAALTGVGCDSGTIVNTDEARPTTQTSTSAPPPLANRPTNDTLVNAFDYASPQPDGTTAYYFTSPSKRWVCAIIPRETAGCQSSTGSTIPIKGAPEHRAGTRRNGRRTERHPGRQGRRAPVRRARRARILLGSRTRRRSAVRQGVDRLRASAATCRRRRESPAPAR